MPMYRIESEISFLLTFSSFNAANLCQVETSTICHKAFAIKRLTIDNLPNEKISNTFWSLKKVDIESMAIILYDLYWTKM